MAFTAIYNDKERHAREIPLGEDAYCACGCGDRMRVWKNVPNTATHLKKVDDMGSAGGKSGGSVDGHTHCTGGEGDDHKRWKGVAADALEDEFSDISAVDAFSEESKSELVKENQVGAPVSDKEYRQGDIVLTFGDRDWQLGEGLIVEVQDANKSKDFARTSQDYIEQGFAVVWLFEDDFIEVTGPSPGRCKLTEVDFRHRARQSAMKYMLTCDRGLPPHPYWSEDPFYDCVASAIKPFRAASDRISTENCVPAKVPTEYWDKKRREYWMNESWGARFPSDQYNDTTKHYRLRAAIGSGTNTRVEATFKQSFILPSEQQYWADTTWRKRFTMWMHDLSDNTPPIADVYEAKAQSMMEMSGVRATLPPECSEQLLDKFYDEAFRIDTADELKTRAVRNGWQQSVDHSPLQNLRSALISVEDYRYTRSVVCSFAAIYIRGLGGGATTQSALDRMLNEDDDMYSDSVSLHNARPNTT
jgi:hypothetical protein